MVKKEKNYKPITTVEIVCTPIVNDNNKVSETNYDLKITNNDCEVIIPINEKVTSLPTNELMDKILDVLNVNKTEINVKEYIPTMPVIIPTSVKDPNNISDPWKEPSKPIVTWTSENIKNK